MSRELLFEFNGFEVYKDSRFVLTNKKDPDAPKALQEINATKFPGAFEQMTAPFIVEGRDPNQGYYDLGFETSSVFYKYLEEGDKKKNVTNAVNNILKPYAQHIGRTQSVLYKDVEFYDNFKFSFTDGDIFDMSSPQDAFYFYSLVLTGKVCPPDKHYLSDYRHSNYCAHDVVSKVKASENANMEKWKVQSSANKMIMKGQFEQLLETLHYIGVRPPLTKESDQAQFVDYIENNINHSPTLRPAFIDASEKDEKEIKIYTRLSEELKRSKSDFEKVGTKIVYKELELGSNLKQIATKLATSEADEFKDVVKILLLSEVK